MRPDMLMAATNIMRDPEDDLPRAAAGLAAQQHDDPERCERAVHEDFGVREVDEAQHAVDEGVAERDKGVDGTEREARDRQRPEVVDEELHPRPPAGRGAW